MTHQSIVTAPEMRAINRSAILETIRREGPIARSSIARRLDVSLPTVIRIVDDLIEEGFVRPKKETEWSGGRRRTLLEFNAEGYVVLGVDMGGTKMYGAISDIGGNILCEIDLGRHGTSGEENFHFLTTLIDDLLANPCLRGRRVLGIGVGAPGITLHREGVVKWAYTLGWRDFPLKARLAEQYKMPITVDNDVNLAALGEFWYGVGQNTQNMVLVANGTGIGAGIIIDGALYRGSHEASGEVGYMIPGRDFLGKSYLDFGAFETLASGTAIAKRIPALLESEPGLAHLDHLTVEDIFVAARLGQKWPWSILDEVVDYMAIIVANLSVSFDPELIVLGGGITRFAEPLVEPILQRIREMVPLPPKLVVSDLGLRATVMGAITTVLHNTSDFYVVRKLT